MPDGTKGQVPCPFIGDSIYFCCGGKLAKRFKGEAVELFRSFNIQNNNVMCLEYEGKLRVSDSEMKEYSKEAGIMEPKELRQLEKRKTDEIIRKLKISSVSGTSKA